MTRLINAEKLAEYKASGVSELTEWQKGWNDAIDTIIEEAPTVDAEPVKHGHWISHDYDFAPAESTQECSVCHEEQPIYMVDNNYCPHCGAKMDEVIEND